VAKESQVLFADCVVLLAQQRSERVWWCCCAQFDVFGNAHGLLASHPVTPFISMHHLELLDPVFPEMSHLEGLRLLTKAMRTEPGSFLQQSIAYDLKRSLSFSISAGYVIQVGVE